MRQANARSGIGGCIRDLRIALGWKQVELARAADMTATALSRIETGKERPEAATVRVLLGILGFSSDAPRLLEILMKRGSL
jgi:transcriptional regulator with XRE-family HTH domain